MIDTNEILATIERTRKDARDRFTTNKATILTAMRDQQIKKVVVSYSGYGDSGCIDSIHAGRDDEAEAVNLSAIAVVVVATSSLFVDGSWRENKCEKTMTFHEALEEFAYDWLEANHGGWENNDGADGEFIFDLEEGRVFITHNSHYTETDTEEVEL